MELVPNNVDADDVIASFAGAFTVAGTTKADGTKDLTRIYVATEKIVMQARWTRDDRLPTSGQFSLIFVSELDDSTWLSMAPWAKASDMMLGPIRVVYGNLWAAACFVHSLAANTVLCRREDCFHALLMSGITGG